jgi:hypothetical protein
MSNRFKSVLSPRIAASKWHCSCTTLFDLTLGFSSIPKPIIYVSIQLSVSKLKVRFYTLLVSMPLRTLLPMLSAWQVFETLTFERSQIYLRVCTYPNHLLVIYHLLLVKNSRLSSPSTNPPYFPIQNRPNIFPNKSSLLTSPTILPK